MTTISAILSRGIRMLGARPINDVASAEELAAGLEAFQDGILNLFPSTHLTDVLISANYTANENERIIDSSGTATITKPSTVVDAVTGATRTPHNGALIEIASATSPSRYVYVTELAGWKALTGLALSDANPLGPQHDEGLAAMMAVRMAPDLQVPNVPQWVVEMATSGRRAIRQRFRQPFIATTDPLLLNVFQRWGATL